METICQGAEAVLKRDGSALIKERVKKSYRLDGIDTKLRRLRTRSEAKLLAAARRAGADVPRVIETTEFLIKMDFIEGNKIKDVLCEGNCRELAQKMAAIAATLHNTGIIHGDLTTSNMVLKDGCLWLIDFGLGFFSSRIEDKAMDLRLLKQIISSTHNDVYETFWDSFEDTYRSSYDEGDKVIKTLHLIEKRGRYKER